MMFSQQYVLWEIFLHKNLFLPEHPLDCIGLWIIQYFIRQKKILYLIKFSVLFKKIYILGKLLSDKGFRVSGRSCFEVIFQLDWFKWNILKVSFGTGVRFLSTFFLIKIYESKPKITPQVLQKKISAAYHANSANEVWRQPDE